MILRLAGPRTRLFERDLNNIEELRRAPISELLFHEGDFLTRTITDGTDPTSESAAFIFTPSNAVATGFVRVCETDDSLSVGHSASLVWLSLSFRKCGVIIILPFLIVK
jgi:hypothetical protein